jgi:hypothetical protein
MALALWCGLRNGQCAPVESQDWYYRDGLLRGSLKSDRPLPLYDANPNHLWNRLFAVFYIRPSNLPSMPDSYPSDVTRLGEYDRKRRRGELNPGPIARRIEGGDMMNLLAWGHTLQFSEPASFERENKVLDEFIQGHGENLIDDPLKKAFLQRDLWAVFDHLIGQDIARFAEGSRQRREILSHKLAIIIKRLALSRSAIQTLPNNYQMAARSDYFSADGAFDSNRNYFPRDLFSNPAEWVEIDTSPEPLNTADKHEGQINLVARDIRGRSYYRIFFRFPGGRKSVEQYLDYLANEAVDWQKAARQGFMALKPNARQIPDGAQAAIVQFMVVLDDQLRPTPTDVAESVRLSVYKNAVGTPDPETNSGAGVIFRIYTGRRRLLFDNLKQGGLERLADDAPTYTVLINGEQDWGISARQQTVVQSCVGCHMHETSRVGVFSLNTIFCFAPEYGMPGIVIPLGSGPIQTLSRAERIVRWKSRQEDYLRLKSYAAAD